jgi:hypothetical protein
MATAILVDGGFFIKRFRSLQPDNAFDPRRAAECIHRWASAANKSVPFSVSNQPVVTGNNRREADTRSIYENAVYTHRWTT